MKTYLVLVIILFTALQAKASEQELIASIMHDQELAWNKGDLEAFMQPYWHSEKLQFIGKSGIKYGWQTTLDNYKKSYPDRETMGQLHFDILQIEVTENTAFVLGTWKLTRSRDILSGFYTLYWKQIDNKWQIIIDHSS